MCIWHDGYKETWQSSELKNIYIYILRFEKCAYKKKDLKTPKPALKVIIF